MEGLGATPLPRFIPIDQRVERCQKARVSVLRLCNIDCASHEIELPLGSNVPAIKDFCKTALLLGFEVRRY